MTYDELYIYEFINGSLQRFVGHWLDERIASYYSRKVRRRLKHYTEHKADMAFIMSFKRQKK